MNEFNWDPWQKKVLEHLGSVTIRAGRQVGKSEVIARKAVDLAVKYPGTKTLVTSASQRQASLLFEKIRGYLQKDEVELLEEPTMTKIKLANLSVIYCVPAGRTGFFIMGFTIDFLFIDESAFVNETVWNSIRPMIAVSRQLRGFGWIFLLSMPFGKGGFFYNSFTDNEFLQIHASSEDCPRIPKDFLAKEKKRLSKQQYAQIWQGEFVDDYRQFFPTALIRECMSIVSWTYETDYKSNGKYYLGVDVARYGGDQNAFVVGELIDKKFKIVKIHTTDRKSLTDSSGQIKKLDEYFHFKRIFIDDGGVGGGLVDMLQEAFGKRKVIGLNNSKKSIFNNGEENRKVIAKEDYYSNALIMMESRTIELIDDLDFLRSLKSITYEYSSSKNLIIKGDYDHITEAFVRCCWAMQDKGYTPKIV
jgi:hypothetical protein